MRKAKWIGLAFAPLVVVSAVIFVWRAGEGKAPTAPPATHAEHHHSEPPPTLPPRVLQALATPELAKPDDRPAPPPGPVAAATGTVRRRMSQAERDTEKARLAAELGPATTYGELMVDPEGREFVMLPGKPKWSVLPGGVRRATPKQWYGQPGDHIRKAPWVMARAELFDKRPDIDRAMSEHIDHAEHRYCADEIYRRGPVTRRLQWSLGLHLTATEGTLYVDGVEPLGDGWPPELLTEDRDCYLQAFRRHTIPWSKEESLWIEFLLVIQPTSSGGPP